LVADEVVDVGLDLVDLGDAGDFGFVECVFGSVRSLIVAFAEPFEVLVFDPGHPALVLVVVVLFQPLGIGLLFLLLGGEVVVFCLCLLLGGFGFLGGIHVGYVLFGAEDGNFVNWSEFL